MTLDVLDVIELGRERVVDVDDDDLPVGLALVQERHLRGQRGHERVPHDAEDLDLLDLAGVADGIADLAHVERVIVALGAGLGVGCGGVFPGLGEGAVVPDVALGVSPGAIASGRTEQVERSENSKPEQSENLYPSEARTSTRTKREPPPEQSENLHPKQAETLPSLPASPRRNPISSPAQRPSRSEGDTQG